MSELITRLINLSYELTGIILPGIIGLLFFILWWTAIGPMAPVWTHGGLPIFNVETIRSIIDSLSVASEIGVAIPLIALCYFIGHLLHWTARSGSASNEAANCRWKRIAYSLAFEIPKPADPFNPKPQRLYDAAQSKLAGSYGTLEWREFYPVAKCYLAQNGTRSLLSTYQNKYTLHRSIATAAALLFWASGAAIAASLLIPGAGGSGQAPNFPLLLFLLASALMLVAGFSSSYIYNWEMFGNTTVTETYSLLYGPRNEPSE